MKNASYALSLPSLAISLLALAACSRTDPGTTEAVCLGQLPESSDGCEPEICIPEVQRYTIENQNPGSPQVFTCTSCSNLPPEQISTDAAPKLMAVRYVEGPLTAQFRFDNRVSLDYTLDNLRTYARSLQGWYETYQGKMRISADAFEVAGYDGHALHLRATVSLDALEYAEQGLPPACQPLPNQISCNLSCFYSAHAPAADGDPGELVLDLHVPFVR